MKSMHKLNVFIEGLHGVYGQTGNIYTFNRQKRMIFIVNRQDLFIVNRQT